MAFQSIRRILPQAVQQAGWSEPVNTVRVFEELKATLTRLWGEERAAFVAPLSFQAGILKVHARAPSAMQELRLIETRLQNEINRALGEKKVVKLLFVDRA
jgi:hypothetical protein